MDDIRPDVVATGLVARRRLILQGLRESRKALLEELRYKVRAYIIQRIREATRFESFTLNGIITLRPCDIGHNPPKGLVAFVLISTLNELNAGANLAEYTTDAETINIYKDEWDEKEYLFTIQLKV